ncbi:RNA polymerase sigma-70 factor [Pedobacter nyackensis]|uniref:RNA polymerase sigma-70 factor, ECF subfamily n=1 Tax=Pedobacter nyackensis TaxID=475255 RepID=A0A1W2DXX8_9SPHI|nr:RNA polymerase sigma-70 factor [Pedobacter nyackensis]SMD01962.1 RNA polymerase sigma-70 factor, ECF subfamily [Pedobacter nyackensis]
MMVKRHSEEHIEMFPEVLFKKFYPRLCDFACYIIKDQEVAEDVVQDAFVVFLEQKENISSHPNAVKSFLYSSVKHACLNKLRHHKVIDTYCKKIPFETLDDPKLLDGIIHAEIIAKIHQAINMLPVDCAMVLRYGYLEGLQNRKIAEQLNISIDAVKYQKQKALSLMRVMLGDTVYLLFIAFLMHK